MQINDCFELFYLFTNNLAETIKIKSPLFEVGLEGNPLANNVIILKMQVSALSRGMNSAYHFADHKSQQ